MPNKKLFTRRTFILTAVKLFLLFILVIRLFYLQIKQSNYFQGLSEKNSTDNIPIIPKRGEIKDYFGNILAKDILLWEVLFIKSQIKTSIDLYINTISSILQLSNDEIAKIKQDYKKSSRQSPILIKQNLTQKEISAIETFSYNLQGLFIRPYYRRNYPYSEVTAHLIGYTGLTDDISKTKNIPTWYIGKSGIEDQLNVFLRGDIGYSKYKVNAHGNILKKLNQISSKDGDNISLTIDIELQRYIYELLSQYNSASAVVMDIENGNILAMPSYPSFDNNIFSLGIPTNLWKELVNNEKAPLSYKPIQGLYPPGSTIKPMLALKALQKGYITPETIYNCSGTLQVGKDLFHCWKKEGHKNVNVNKAIAESCDIFFYNLANKLTLEDMCDVARDFGWGSTHLPLVRGEQKGRLLDNSTYKLTFGDLTIGAIGQSIWLTTPLQLACMAATIASGGKKVTPSLIKQIEYPNKILYPENIKENEIIPYNPEHIELVQKAMFNSVNKKNGGAALARTYNPNWQMAAKTGTAQVRRISLEERKRGILQNYKLPWRVRDHALVVGFVPFDKPKYALSIVIEHGGGSGFTTSPMAGKIAKFLQQRDSVYQAEKDKIKQIIEDNKKL